MAHLEIENGAAAGDQLQFHGRLVCSPEIRSRPVSPHLDEHRQSGAYSMTPPPNLLWIQREMRESVGVM